MCVYHITIVTNTNSNLEFEPSSFMDGLLFQSTQGAVVLPISISVDEIQDDGVNGVVSFCLNCFKFEDVRLSRCAENTCKAQLIHVRPYAAPTVQTEIRNRKSITNALPGLQFASETDVIVKLTGVDLSLRIQQYLSDRNEYVPTRRSNSYTIAAKKPYGYMINTHSIRINVSRQKLDDLLNRFTQTNPNRRLSRKDVLHTIAHLWVKSISLTTGITAEFFLYHLNVDGHDPSIDISESQEGGGGYLELFVERLSSSTNSVLRDLHSIVNCGEHQNIQNNQTSLRIYNEIRNIDLINVFRLSKKADIVTECGKRLADIQDPEIEENYPACYDGCPYCIALYGCDVGSEEQYDVLSLDVAKNYVDLLTIETTDNKRASSLIADGGILVKKDGGMFGVFLL